MSLRKCIPILRILLVALLVAGCVDVSATFANDQSRRFHLRYGVRLTGLKRFKRIRVWVPMPTTDSAQNVTLVQNSLPRGSYRVTRDSKFGNTIVYLQIDSSLQEFQFYIEYLVERKELCVLGQGKGVKLAALLADIDHQWFLSPNKLVPTTGKPLVLLPAFGSATSIVQRARKLYDRVDAHVKYDKSIPGFGKGDVLWVCESGCGNCTDFHSLFISLARSQKIPARFEIGFSLPAKRGSGNISGYHCWASFFDDEHGWVPVDISEADKQPDLKDYYFGNLTENRIAFSVGRDILLDPLQSGPPLNFFVYPYIEGDGKPIPKSHTNLEIEYEDIRD